MSIAMSRDSVRVTLQWSPALPVLVFLLLASCATVAAPSSPSTAATPPAAVVQQGTSTAKASPAAPPAATPLAVDRPETDLLARAVPVPAVPVRVPNIVDLPTPPLPQMLNVPVIPPPPLVASLQPSVRETTPRLGSVRVSSPSAAANASHSGSTGAGHLPVPPSPRAAVPLPRATAAGSSAPTTSSPSSAAAPVASAAVPAASAATPPTTGIPGAGSAGGSVATPRAKTPSPPAALPGSSSAAQPRASSSGVTAQSASGVATSAPRTVYAKVGDDITVALNGQGWIFTGGVGGSEHWKTGVRYESRSSDSTGTTFIFKAKALGKWTLGFQQQNAATGASTEQAFDIHVLTPAVFDRTIAAKSAKGSGGGRLASAPSGGAAVANGELATADWLYKEGNYREALDAYEKAWQPDDPSLTEKIAELAYRVGRYGVAHKYWQKNFYLTGTQYGDLAVAGLMKTATAQKDAPELRALFDYVRSLKGVAFREDLLNAGRFLYDASDWNVALRYLGEYLNRYNGHTGADVADFLLGKIYSGPTEMQDAQKAMDYFLRVVNDYPTSDYYSRAKANIMYLNRQYFQIR